ncbi:hypothetical protein [Methylobacter sp.]|uniref:hypothetical protein n=1 Tax=Methylobacter sp. TaxID=2051955 RepID=UPI0012158F85|nr:hypothetical protein [Methylobacter sp.]TAK60619.1 MAG: hypothetical protein EPO18_16625 [Methylobacter sp.]
MNINDLNTLEQLEQFLTGSQAVAFLIASSTDKATKAYGARWLNSNPHRWINAPKASWYAFWLKPPAIRQQITRLIKQVPRHQQD